MKIPRAQIVSLVFLRIALGLSIPCPNPFGILQLSEARTRGSSDEVIYRNSTVGFEERRIRISPQGRAGQLVDVFWLWAKSLLSCLSGFSLRRLRRGSAGAAFGKLWRVDLE